MNFVQEAMGDADAILFVTDLFETEFANSQVKIDVFASLVKHTNRHTLRTYTANKNGPRYGSACANQPRFCQISRYNAIPMPHWNASDIRYCGTPNARDSKEMSSAAAAGPGHLPDWFGPFLFSWT